MRAGERRAAPFRVLIAMGLLCSMIVAGSGAAHADIASDIAATKARLAALQDQTEQISEQYNAAQIALAAAERTSAAAQSKADQAAQLLSQRRAGVRKLARTMYMDASLGSFTAFVSAGDPETFLDRASSATEVAGQRSQAIDALRSQIKVANDASRAADAAKRDAQQVADAAAAKRTAILAAVSQQQALLDHLQQEQARLIAEAQAALAAAQAKERAAKAAALAQAEQQAQELAAQRAAVAASTPSSQPAPAEVAPDPGPPNGDAVSIALSWARREIGKPYVYGAAGPDSFDCSGLVMYVYGKAGIALPHYTGDQWNAGRHVSRDELQPGDLVFFYSDVHHVGLYVGGGEMIDAPHTGATVEQVPVWWDAYTGAVRVTG
ncbi:MAG TPA: C40 family peptidase [Mycobacteriales bacterium]|nr:C40 family peptidase [Mycobacteriales bacterium]